MKKLLYKLTGLLLMLLPLILVISACIVANGWICTLFIVCASLVTVIVGFGIVWLIFFGAELFFNGNN